MLSNLLHGLQIYLIAGIVFSFGYLIQVKIVEPYILKIKAFKHGYFDLFIAVAVVFVWPVGAYLIIKETFEKVALHIQTCRRRA